MRTRIARAAAIVTTMALMVLPATPADALTSKDIAARISSLKGSIQKVGARLDRAERALQEATAAINDHQRKLAQAQARRASLREAIAKRATQLYMFATGMEGRFTDDLDLYVARMTYLEQISVGERGVLEEVRAISLHAAEESKALRAARLRASRQTKELDDRRDELFSKLREMEQLQRYLAAVSPRGSLRGSRSARGTICPLTGYHYISNNFGDPRPGGPHTGTDIAAPYGTPARALLPGTIVGVPRGGWIGIGIILRDATGTEWWYAHMSSASVSVGEHVSQGEFIGRVGCSGNCSGPHLHFEWHPGGGAPRDPYRLLAAAC